MIKSDNECTYQEKLKQVYKAISFELNHYETLKVAKKAKGSKKTSKSESDSDSD